MTDNGMTAHGIKNNGIHSRRDRLTYNKAVHQTGPSLPATSAAGW